MNENYCLSIDVNYINREVNFMNQDNDSEFTLNIIECVSQKFKGCN